MRFLLINFNNFSDSNGSDLGSDCFFRCVHMNFKSALFIVWHIFWHIGRWRIVLIATYFFQIFYLTFHLAFHLTYCLQLDSQFKISQNHWFIQNSNWKLYKMQVIACPISFSPLLQNQRINTHLCGHVYHEECEARIRWVDFVKDFARDFVYSLNHYQTVWNSSRNSPW